MNRRALLSLVLSVGTVAALPLTSAAQAATVVNRDETAAKVTVIDGITREDHLLGPGKTLDGVCQKGCIIRLNDSEKDEYELDGSERVTVEDGFLYFDGSTAEAAPQGGGERRGPAE